MSEGRDEIQAGLQPERTALAWERTAISTIVAGVLLARYAAQDAHWTIALIGIAHTVLGAVVLVWAGYHYDNLHGASTPGSEIVHPGATRVVGLGTVLLSGSALVLALTLAIAG